MEFLRVGAQAFGRSFASGVAERIVASIEAPSEYMTGYEVSPVLLQLAALTIWRRLGGKDVVTITEQDLRSNDVDVALQEFYDQTVRAVAATKIISETELREWIEREMFRNDLGIALAAGATTTTAGMPNEVLNELSRRFLLREVNRGGVLYYEIFHDLLIRPIRQSNKAWRMGSWERVKRVFLSVLGRVMRLRITTAPPASTP